MANMLILTPAAKYGLLPVTKDSGIWMEKFTHMLQEMHARHGPYPSGFRSDIFTQEPLPNFASELAKKAAHRLSSLNLKRGDVFLKYGKREYMERLVERGALRIQPASFFALKDHNGAIRDDELTLNLSLPLSKEEYSNLRAKFLHGAASRHDDSMEKCLPPIANRVEIQVLSDSDYWLYCVTQSIESRLFIDFDAEACVIFRDKTKFARLLRTATLNALPGTPMIDGDAEYIDPLLPQSGNIFVPFAKDFRYSYQEEHRFCWMPPTPAKQLSFIDVEIGPLGDIADLIVL